MARRFQFRFLRLDGRTGVMNFLSAKYETLMSLMFSLRDFRTDRHIVVIESDDWGAIRMPSVEVRSQLLAEGYAVNERPYEWYDTLETNEDVEALFSVLRKFRDFRGHHPVITANFLQQNPDFAKIQANGFSEYFGESIADTYKHYPKSDRVMEMVHQGVAEGLIMPQCHGREHLNIRRWMRDLQTGNKDVLRSFYAGMPGIFPKDNPSSGNKYVVALHLESASEQNEIEMIVEEALGLFENTWGFRSNTFVACNYTWNDGVEKVLQRNDVRMIQTGRKQELSTYSGGRFHFSGERGRYDNVYSVRNCNFEPSVCAPCRLPGNLLSQVERCFESRRVAVISSHRINFAGGLDVANRIRTLNMLEEMLDWVQRKYPDVEYMSSDKLMEVYG